MAFNTNYHDSGLFGVYAVTDRDRSAECSWTVGGGEAWEAWASCRAQSLARGFGESAGRH
jgi:hypothetical protein